jgi:AraC family transcriptional regulator
MVNLACHPFMENSVRPSPACRDVPGGRPIGKVPLPNHRLQRVLERIHTHYHTNLNLAELAAEAGYSRAHFIRMFRASVGRTPHRYLLDYRLEKAQALLEQGSLPVTEIAAACGFVSHAHFSTAFRARFGVPPSDYRRLLPRR